MHGARLAGLAARADLFRRLRRSAESALADRQALELAPTDAERRYHSKRLSDILAG
jgi:RNA polymerase sigma-70 factor (ECF subfamily)